MREPMLQIENKEFGNTPTWGLCPSEAGSGEHDERPGKQAIAKLYKSPSSAPWHGMKVNENEM